MAGLRESLPDAVLTRRLFVRAFGVWLGVRLAIQALVTLPTGHLDLRPIWIGLPGAFLLAAIVGLLGLVDVARRSERLLFANLGIPRRTVAVISAAAALAGEALTALLLGATG